MSALSLTLTDLPAAVTAAVLDLLAGAYATGDAALAVLVMVINKEAVMGEITVRDDEANLTAKVTALDAEGHETTFDELPTWQSSDEAVATVTADDDGYGATFTIGAPGSAIITVTGVETGSGERVEIVSTGLINVTAGDAVVGSVEFAVQ